MGVRAIITEQALRSESAQRLSPEEAAAVLLEMRRQAEQRMLDACQEFQDITFEMEWRLQEWQNLIERRKKLLRAQKKSEGVELRFNANAKKRTSKLPGEKAFQRYGAHVSRQQIELENLIATASAAILTRNEEGGYLEKEILMLQSKTDRITDCLRQLHHPKAQVAHNIEERIGALARLAYEHDTSTAPDIGDFESLLHAVEEVESRLRQSR